MSKGSRVALAGWALSFGAAVALEVTVLFEFAPIFSDFIKITLYLWVPSALMASVVALITRHRADGASSRAGFALCTFALLLPAWLVAIRPFDPYSTGVVGRAALAAVAAVTLGVICGPLLTRWRPLPWVLTSVVLLAAWVRPRPVVPEGDPVAVEAARVAVDDRVLVVGLDGATWDVIDPLIRTGELPTFARLVSEGVRGTLISTVSPIMPMSNSASGGMRSPVLWTSVITGREPKDHGILDMEVTYVPGLRDPLPFRVPISWDGFVYQPVNAGMQRVKTLWTIFSEHGLRVGSVAWWPSWPVESVNGFIVSDRYRGEADGTGRVEPPDLVDRYEMVRLFEDFEVGNIFVDCEDVGLDDSFVPERLTRMFRHDHFAGVVSPDLLAAEDWDFASVYLKAPDVAQHYFWHWHDPELRVSRPRYEEFPYDPVVGAYRHVDDVLAALVAATDERTTILVVSDHGAGTWQEEHGFVLHLWNKQRIRDRWMGNHRPDGIFLAWGREAAKGVRLDRPVSLVDVAPTALHILGFPVARDFDGRVLTGALRTDGAGARAPVHVASYETEIRQAVYEVDPALDASIEADHRSLGYLN